MRWGGGDGDGKMAAHEPLGFHLVVRDRNLDQHKWFSKGGRLPLSLSFLTLITVVQVRQNVRIRRDISEARRVRPKTASGGTVSVFGSE